MISKIRGTRDIIDSSLFMFICKALQNHFLKNNFHEIVLPIIEPLELFQRSLGNETDVVSKEMFIAYSTSMEQSSEGKICLRPEMTASVVRAFIENNITELPWNIFSIGPCFRYERPQKGRYRQFNQCTIEMIGSHSLNSDVRLLMILNQFFSLFFTPNEYKLDINFLGCTQDRISHKNALHDFLNNIQNTICETCKIRQQTNTLRIFDCKQIICQSQYINAPTILNCLCVKCNQEWKNLQEQLNILKIEYIINTKLVRGLDYYNKTVFEFTSTLLGAQSAFCGGGRYDSLIANIGNGQDQPAIGAAIGIDRLIIMLESIQTRLNMPPQQPLIVIIPLSELQHSIALIIENELTLLPYRTNILFDGSIKNNLKKANKQNALYVIIIGSNEQALDTVIFKNMQTGEEYSIPRSELLTKLII